MSAAEDLIEQRRGISARSATMAEAEVLNHNAKAALAELLNAAHHRASQI